MRRLIFFLINLTAFIPPLHSISVTEYIQQHGMPQPNKGGCLTFSDENLTDLTGLQDIANTAKNIVQNIDQYRSKLHNSL